MTQTNARTAHGLSLSLWKARDIINIPPVHVHVEAADYLYCVTPGRRCLLWQHSHWGKCFPVRVCCSHMLCKQPHTFCCSLVAHLPPPAAQYAGATTGQTRPSRQKSTGTLEQSDTNVHFHWLFCVTIWCFSSQGVDPLRQQTGACVGDTGEQ